jgi:hypothetical protein
VDAAAINVRLSGTLAARLGVLIVEASPDRVVAELEIRDDTFGRSAARSTEGR